MLIHRIQHHLLALCPHRQHLKPEIAADAQGVISWTLAFAHGTPTSRTLISPLIAEGAFLLRAKTLPLPMF
jgi:hypothetical protein